MANAKISDITTSTTALAATHLFEVENGSGTSEKVSGTVLAAFGRAQTAAQLVAGSNVTLTAGSSGATATLTIAASGSGGGTAQHIGYKSQYWYRFGLYSVGSFLTVADTVYVRPFYVDQTVTLDRGGLHPITGQAGGSGLVGIYANDPTTTRPAARMISSAAATLTGSGTTQAVTLTADSGFSLTLAPGWYWAACLFTATSTMPTVSGVLASDSWSAAELGIIDGTGNVSSGVSGYGISGKAFGSGLPTTLAGSTFSPIVAIACPVSLFRVA